MFRALVVDDEPPARDLMRRLLARHPEVEIAGEARSVAEAAEKCGQLRLDVVFLDVQMPREDGFALLPRLTAPLPAIIFVTAFDTFAVRAFEVNAVDYLLKPIAPDRLARALARVATFAPTNASTVESAPSPVALLPTDTVFLRSDRGLRTAPVAAITLIEAAENYTHVHLVDAPPVLVRRALSEWDRILPPALFVRVERSLLINRSAVQRLDVVSRDVAHAHVAGRATPLVLARRASLRLRQALAGP